MAGFLGLTAGFDAVVAKAAADSCSGLWSLSRNTFYGYCKNSAYVSLQAANMGDLKIAVTF